MNKEFIPYEQALELKELGFDIRPNFGGNTSLYSKNGYHTFYTNYGVMGSGLSDGYIYAPTFSQSFRWFREKYKLIHEISWSKYKGGLNFDYDIFSLVLPTDDELGDENDMTSDKSMETYDSLVNKDFRWHECDTYEEAENACINKLIEIVKDGTKINTRED
jgi:hypothetical protein